MKANQIIPSQTGNSAPLSPVAAKSAGLVCAAGERTKFQKSQFIPTLDQIINKLKPENQAMKKHLLTLTAILLLQDGIHNRAAAADASPAVISTNNDVLTVAVFDFESKDEAVRDLGPKVATMLNATLSANPAVITVERQELEKALGEQEMGLSGTISPDTAAKVGQLTGAKVLVTGRVFKVENQTMIVAKVIGTETSRVYGQMVSGKPSDSIVDLSSQLAEKIGTTVAEKGSTLTAKVETREERIAKLKKVVDNKKLPVVAVKITEHHYGPAIIDPAAETELSLILQECGFKLADANTKLKADVEITGEAFSAYGMQKGNLFSCKSRVELKVRDVATGNIIAVDRHTSVGVDIAEQTAAKTALENAADTLAERLIPKLAQ